jgi:DegV family protein with EDD domain
MANVIILTDSTAYIPEELIKQNPIDVIPLTLIWDGNSYKDGVDITPDEFYVKLAASNTMPKTSQVSVFEYEQAFQKLVDQGYEVLNLGLSSGISSSFFSAEQAAKSFDSSKVDLFDTKLVSMALGFQVLTAARAAKEGATLAECKAIAQDAYNKIGVYFTVDTLKYLAAGGRINSAKRLVGSALDLKPILEISDGKIELVESVRSKKKAIRRMISLVEKGINGRKPVRLSVFHALDHDNAIALQAEIKDLFNPEEEILSFVSPVVGAHVGPGTISIAYMAG